MDKNSLRGSVRDFQRHIFKKAGVDEARQFYDLSDAHRDFMIKINGLWRGRGIDTKVIADVDEAVMLSQKEWEDLENEFDSLLK